MCPTPLARAPLAANSCRWYAGAVKVRSFWHQIEIKKLDELQFELASGRAGFEERGNGEQAVKSLEGAGIVGLFEKGDDECEQGRGLDGGAVGGVKEVKKKLSGVSGEH